MAEIKLSGVRGHDGQDGYAGCHHGENGSNAGHAEDGGDGGVAYLRVQRVPESVSAILVTGTIHGQPFAQSFELGQAGHLNIDASGGKGGRGGYGGNGANGRPGQDGMNATRYTNGTNGGSGGNGGNGGNGTSGAHGGKGGFVQIIVSEADMDLLMMLGPICIEGGRGGSAGRNGHGGAGGPGGRGGSSYTYSTTSTSTYRDSNGNTQTQHHTHWHTNPGGMNGPSGNSGHDGSAHLHCGRDGADGSFEFIVEHLNGPVKYLNKYDLKLLDFGIIFYEEDGIIEPGEKAYISTLTLHNIGLMPTPIQTDFFVSLVDNNWLQGIGNLQIPRAIAPGDLITIPFKHEFLINYPIFKPSLGRYLPSTIVVQPKPLMIQYPISLSQFQCLRTFSPGQTSKVLVTLKNNSAFEIGGLARPAQLHLLKGDGEFDTATIEFSYQDKKLPLESAYQVEIPIIPPMSSIVIQMNITIPNVGYLLKACFNVQVYLNDHRNTTLPFPCIHTFPYDIRTGFHYVPFPEQDAVFVINEKTLIQEVNYVQEMCQYFGLKPNFYDINMNGNINLFEPLPHLQTTLAKDLENKTLIIINNQITISSTSQDVVQAWTMDFLRKDELLRAIAEHHVHFVIFSPHKHNYNAWTFKFDPESPLFNEEKEFLAAEYGFSERPFAEKIGSSVQIHAVKKMISFQSKIQQLEEFTSEYVDNVQRRFANHSYLAVPLLRDNLPNKRIGKVGIMRTPPKLGSYLQFMDFNQIMARPTDFAVPILNTIDIDRKTKMLVKLSQNVEGLNPFYLALEESLIYTLGREIQIGCASKHSRKFNFDDVTCFLTVIKNSYKENKSLKIKVLESLFIRLKLIADKQSKVADYLIFWVAHAKLLRKLSSKLKDLLKLMESDKQSKLDQQTILKTIVNDYKLKKKQYPALPKYLLHTKLKLDIDTYRQWYAFKNVINEQELNTFRTNEANHIAQCVKLVDFKRQLDAQLAL
eukprot:403341583